MRLWWILLLVPTASALPLSLVLDPIVLADPAGDVSGDPIDAGAPGYIDIVESVLDLDGTRLRFEVQMADVTLLTQAHSLKNDRPAWTVFSAMDTRFLLAILVEAEPLRFDGDPVLDEEARLYRWDDAWVQTGTFPTDHDHAQGRFAVDVPLDQIRDQDGFPLAPGAVVTMLELHARDTDAEIIYDPNRDPRGGGDLNGLFQLYQDDVDVPADAILAVPASLEGLLQVVTDDPLRYSNGGGSFRWPVQVHNPLDREVAAEIRIEASDGVETRAPSTLVLAAKQTRVIDVFATLPFGHRHGGSVDINVHFGVGGDDTILALGVHFLDIAQPAGHHDTLWLHGEAGQAINGQGVTDPGAGWMNTLEDDPRATATAFRGGSGGCGGNNGEYWFFPLRPGLLIGLDARTDDAATLDATFFHGNLPPVPGTIHAKLVLDDGSGPLGDLRGDLREDEDAYRGPLDVPLGGSQRITMELPVPQALDRVVPQHDMPNLVLALVFCPDIGANPQSSYSTGALPALRIEPGAALVLPLEEYQEAIDVLPGDGALLRVDGPLARAAPGAHVLWHVHVDPSGGAYRPSLFGPAKAYTTLHAEDVLPGPGTVPVSIQVPDTAEGDLLQVILILENVDDPADTSSIVLGVVVDQRATRDDADAVAALNSPGHHDTPAPFVLLALACALVLRRR